MSDYDRWLTTPPDPDVVGKCANCGDELYARCEYVRDRCDDEWYCSDACYVEKRREAGDLVTEVISNDA